MVPRPRNVHFSAVQREPGFMGDLCVRTGTFPDQIGECGFGTFNATHGDCCYSASDFSIYMYVDTPIYNNFNLVVRSTLLSTPPTEGACPDYSYQYTVSWY